MSLQMARYCSSVCVCVCTRAHVHMCQIFFILYPVGRHLGSFHNLPIVDKAAINIGVYITSVFLYSLGKYPVLQLLSCRVVLFLTFWGTSALFSKVDAPVCMPTNSAKEFSFVQSSPTTFLIKIHHKVGIDETYLNIIKAIYKKCIVNIIFDGEKPRASPLRSGTIQRCPLSPLLFNTVLEVLASAIRKKKEIKGIQFSK